MTLYMDEPVKLEKAPEKRKSLTPEEISGKDSSFLIKTEAEQDSKKYSVDETDYLVELSQLINANPSGEMRGSKIAVRMFSFPTGKIIMGIVVSEMDDSFLVVMPNAIDAQEDGSLKISSISPSALARMYKSIVGLTCIPEPKFTLPYLTVVRSNFHKVPGFFNETRKAQVESLIIQLEEGYKEEALENRRKAVQKTSHTSSQFTPPEALSSRVRH